jgi:putative membrane protein
MEWLNKHKSKVLIGIVILFHIVGSIGLSIPNQKSYFLSLSPYNLLLSFIVIILATKNKKLLFFLFVFFIFLIGYLVEWIGVHTQLLFGNYSYGNNLGIKFFEIPPIIGINWVVLILVSHSVALAIIKDKLFTPILAALFMVGLDILIEPVAINSDYWTWESNVIPFYNYVCWFWISLIIHFIYQKIKLTEQNSVYNCLYVVLVVFFTLQLINLKS